MTLSLMTYHQCMIFRFIYLCGKNILYDEAMCGSYYVWYVKYFTYCAQKNFFSAEFPFLILKNIFLITVLCGFAHTLKR